jgi:uncharacterized membrane protein YdbT with pleckstrin-like domain
MTIIIAGFIPFMMLVLGPADEELAKQYDYIVACLPKVKAAWTEHKKELAAEKHRQKQERAEREEEEQEQEERRERALRRAEEAAQNQAAVAAGQSVRQSVVFTMPTKSVALSFILAFFFGPLGMLYSTVAGGLIMLMVSILVGCLTLGSGLLITWPICIIWAMVAASSYNQNLLRGHRQH